MDRSTTNIALLIGVVGSLGVGLALLLSPLFETGFFITSVAILLIILGLMGTMPLTTRFLWPTKGLDVTN